MLLTRSLTCGVGASRVRCPSGDWTIASANAPSGEDCHIPTTWGGGGFNHAAFPLNGAHAALACDACHAGVMNRGRRA